MSYNYNQAAVATSKDIQELKRVLRQQNKPKLKQYLKIYNRPVSNLEIKALLSSNDLKLHDLQDFTWRNHHLNTAQLNQIFKLKHAYNKEDWNTWEYGHNNKHTVVVHQHK